MTTVCVLLKEDVKLGEIDDLFLPGPGFKIIGSDSSTPEPFCGAKLLYYLIRWLWLAPNTKLKYLKELFLLIDRYWMTFQSGGMVGVATICIHVSASCVAQLLNRPRISGGFFTRLSLKTVFLHAEMLCSRFAHSKRENVNYNLYVKSCFALWGNLSFWLQHPPKHRENLTASFVAVPLCESTTTLPNSNLWGHLASFWQLRAFPCWSERWVEYFPNETSPLLRDKVQLWLG